MAWRNNSARRLTLDALMLALSAVLSYLEFLLPLPLPGVHLGLSHVPIMLLYLKVGCADAAAVSIARLLAVTLPTGGATAFIFALLGSLLSFLALPLLARRTGRLGLGIASAALHVTGQMLAAVTLYGTVGILFTYYPVLLAAALPTGACSGLILYLTETKGARLFDTP